MNLKKKNEMIICKAFYAKIVLLKEEIFEAEKEVALINIYKEK